MRQSLDMWIMDARDSLEESGRANSPTWVMFETMNLINDDFLEEEGITIVDVAEAVEAHIEGGLY